MGTGTAAAASVASSIMGGRARYSENMTQAMLAESQAKDTDLQALQASERRREDLRAALASVSAMRAQRGLSLDTPSAQAIEREMRRQSVRDEGVERYGYVNRSGALRLQSKSFKRAARLGLAQGYLQSVVTLSETGSDVAAAMGGGR